MDILIVYDKYQTHTNTVFEYVNAFKQFSKNAHYFIHYLEPISFERLSVFDVILIHYSVRLNLGPSNSFWEKVLLKFGGKKVLFIQDEYDSPEITRNLIKSISFDLVFTVVPENHIKRVYDPEYFPKTKFISCLTGYISSTDETVMDLPKIEDRPIDVGYRGRTLPFWYGDLGQEKQVIAEKFIKFSKASDLVIDVSSSDRARIYGDNWVNFLKRSKTTLGTESGSNIFDEGGIIQNDIKNYLLVNPKATYQEIKAEVLKGKIEVPIMNQISPRIFEAIKYKTGLVLFEGNYSSIINQGVHYISLKKDFSNISKVIEKIKNIDLVQEMVDRTYSDIIETTKYNYETFIRFYDEHVNKLEVENLFLRRSSPILSSIITEKPARIKEVKLHPALRFFWNKIPNNLKPKFKNFMRNMLSGWKT